MKARVVIPTASGELISYDIAAHEGSRDGCELRIVFATDEEHFERWLFYLLRDIGAHVVTDEPQEFRRKLGLNDEEAGVLDEHAFETPVLPRHPATA